MRWESPITRSRSTCRRTGRSAVSQGGRSRAGCVARAVVKLPAIPGDGGQPDRRTVRPSPVRSPSQVWWTVSRFAWRIRRARPLHDRGHPGRRVGPSPLLAGRLTAVSQRPINNVVDATQLHPVRASISRSIAFGSREVARPAVVVRRARPGEKIVTLDGVTRTLTADMTAICDAEHPTNCRRRDGERGVGSERRHEGSRARVRLLSADRIRPHPRALELSSESSYRFERGIDMLGMPDALRRAIELIIAVAGGEVAARPRSTCGPAPAGADDLPPPERVTGSSGWPSSALRWSVLLTRGRVLRRGRKTAARGAGPGLAP